MDRYFTYGMGIVCGLPSVTLLGEKADWLRLLARLDRLPTFGDEPAEWAEMLRPILVRFAAAFDGSPDVTFWERIVSRDSYMCGQDLLSGWITAFCVWDADGKWLAKSRAFRTEDTAEGSFIKGPQRECISPAHQSCISQDLDLRRIPSYSRRRLVRWSFVHARRRSVLHARYGQNPCGLRIC